MAAEEGQGAPKTVGVIIKICGHRAGLSKRELCPSCERPVPPGEAPFPMGEKGPASQGFQGSRSVALTRSW